MAIGLIVRMGASWAERGSLTRVLLAVEKCWGGRRESSCELSCGMPDTPLASIKSAISSRRVIRTPFGMLPDGNAVDLYTLTNASGATRSVMTYGATVTSLTVPDRAGTFADIVLGYDTLEGYLHDSP